MISKSSFFIWNNGKCRLLYTLIILCNIIKVSSGYLLYGNGIIRNTQINITNPLNLSTSVDNFKTNNTKINKFHLKDQNIEDPVPSRVNDGDEKGGNANQLQDTGEYSSDDIIVLEGLNAVRKRPGMYIGNTGERGVHQLLYEVLDNSVDEYLAGFCNRITVSLMKDGSVEVSDNGRGIPCDISPKTGKSGLETVLTVLHSGGKFQDIFPPNSTSMGSEDQNGVKSRKKGEKEHEEKKVYEYSSGLHGVGLSVVNALSELLIVDVYKGPKSYHIELSKGNIVKPLTEFSESETNDKPNHNLKRYGTTIRFLPDYKNIFKTHHQHTETEKEDYDTTTDKSGLDNTCCGCKNGFILDLIKTRARELSYLNPGLSIKLVDYRITDENNEPWEETYRNTGGTKSFLEELIKDKTPLYKPISYITIKGVISNINVEVSFSWSLESYTALIKAYANNVSTIAGTHIDGFKTSITRCVNGLLKKYGYFKGNVKPLNGEFIREGMTAVISVKLTGAEFDGQTKTKLGNALVKTVTEKIVNEQFTNILENNKELLLAIHNKSQAAKKAFDAARTAKDLIRQKSSSIISNISGKLTECSSSKVENNELFIVEGESAAGNAKQARNRQFQAVLPLKGKILNIEKITDNSKVLENQQIQVKCFQSNQTLQLLMNSIGISINPVTWRQNDLAEGTHMALDPLIEMNNNLSKLRYGKIILLTDADVDGSHLKSLLLCLLYRLCPSLYLHGRVYVASPPLYRITNLRNKRYIYSWSQEHLLKTIKELNSKYSPKDTTESVREKGNVDDLRTEYEDEFNDDGDDREEGVEEIELKTELGSNITKDKESDELDLYNINKTLSKNNKHLIIQRFKGLGEMMANQLWETTMDPKRRILKRIVVSQEPEISEIIRLLMGSDVQSRKQYIFNNSGAFNLEDLDI